MRSIVAVPILLLTFTGVLSAQTSGPIHHLYLRGEPIPECPIGFTAQRYGFTAALRQVARNEGTQYAPSLQLQFDRTRAPGIARISIVVHGTAGIPQVLPVAAGQANGAASQAFELTRSNGRFDPVQYVVSDSVPLVTRIEITAIDYADGTTWREPTANACSAAPSPFILVNASAQP